MIKILNPSLRLFPHTLNSFDVFPGDDKMEIVICASVKSKHACLMHDPIPSVK